MRLCTLEFILREAGTNIRRNVLMSLACVTTVAVTLGVSAFVVLAFRNTDNVLHRVAQELVVAAYLNTDVDARERTMVGKEISEIPDVQGRPVLVSKEHAWRTFSATIPDTLKGEVDDNPLPDTFMIRVDAPIHVPAVAQQVAALPEVEKINAPYLEARRAGAIIRFARVASTSMTILMVFITTFLVMNTIRLTLYARRQEIRVMQLVGAANGYIRTPFILEGLVLGAMGGVLACASVAAGYPYLLGLARHAMAFDLPLLNPGRNLLPFYGDIVGLGAVVGAFGSLVSVRRFLRPVELQAPVRRLRKNEVIQLEASRTRVHEPREGERFPAAGADRSAADRSAADRSAAGPIQVFPIDFDDDDLYPLRRRSDRLSSDRLSSDRLSSDDEELDSSDPTLPADTGSEPSPPGSEQGADSRPEHGEERGRPPVLAAASTDAAAARDQVDSDAARV